LADDLELGLLRTALGELDLVALAVPVHLDDHALGAGVDDRDADAVEAAGHLVAAAAELAAAAERGEGDLDAGHLEPGVHVGRDATAVVGHATAAVRQQGDVDAVAVAGHGFVDGVVPDLPHQVVEARDPRAADVHAGALAHVREALEDRHGTGGVG